MILHIFCNIYFLKKISIKKNKTTIIFACIMTTFTEMTLQSHMVHSLICLNSKCFDLILHIEKNNFTIMFSAFFLFVFYKHAGDILTNNVVL